MRFPLMCLGVTTRGDYMRRVRQRSAPFLVLLSVFASIESRAFDAEGLLQRADAYRNPAQSFKMTIDVKTPDSDSKFEVFLKGTAKTLIVTKAPPRDRGRNMLMLDRDFYSYVPNLKRSVRLSLAQKFSGQVANGDIARTRWYGDYKPVIAAQEGAATVLNLDGEKTNLTYQKIRLWVEKVPRGNLFEPSFQS